MEQIVVRDILQELLSVCLLACVCVSAWGSQMHWEKSLKSQGIQILVQFSKRLRLKLLHISGQ